MAEFSLIIPCHDEEDFLEDTVQMYSCLDAEVVLVEDGCTDSTPELAKAIADGSSDITHLHFDEKLGKGRAVEKGFRAASHDRLLFVDADGVIPAEYVSEVAEELKTQGLVIGRRNAEDREQLRLMFSKAYNLMVRLLYGSTFTDHQCGLKGIRREKFERLTPLDSHHWFWDTEVILRAENAGISIKQVEVEYNPEGDSEVDLMHDSAAMAQKAFRFVRQNPEFKSRLIEIAQFGVVGLLGLSVENTIIWALQAGTPLLLSKAVGAEASILVMFLANNYWTYGADDFNLKQLFRSHQVRILGVLISAILLLALEMIGMNVILANTLSVLLGFAFNYAFETFYTWGQK